VKRALILESEPFYGKFLEDDAMKLKHKILP